jgi:hypothetical protein
MVGYYLDTNRIQYYVDYLQNTHIVCTISLDNYLVTSICRINMLNIYQDNIIVEMRSI